MLLRPSAAHISAWRGASWVQVRVYRKGLALKLKIGDEQGQPAETGAPASAKLSVSRGIPTPGREPQQTDQSDQSGNSPFRTCRTRVPAGGTRVDLPTRVGIPNVD
eukprot:847985-Rhodomonas_salina.1